MPPARSGIADYSAALLAELQLIADVTCFASAPLGYEPAAFDVALYQLGNNSDHDFVYEAALKYPGVVVLHEANLHHLIADVTIRRGDWDAYVRECEFEGGSRALADAEAARALSRGPDYEGVPMLRRIVSTARGVIAHSEFVMERVLELGYSGPNAVIPHGAWVGERPAREAPAESRGSIRHRLGLDDSTPLLGAFGFIKPYKRIAETLRALRRAVRVHPRTRMILGGEPHPDLPIAQLIRTLELEPHVRVLGYTPESDFAACISACDIIVNLRYPTVGESSGSLLRAFSAGRPALVSDVGSFAELPDDVCLKVPVGAGEEELIFEYLNLLLSRPEVGLLIGAQARAWVERECSWHIVAAKYLGFLSAVARLEKPSWTKKISVLPNVSPIAPEYVSSWAIDPPSRDYLEKHAARLNHTLDVTPPGDAAKSILEMGSYMQITPALKYKLGYGTVRGCYFGPLGRIDRKLVTSADGEEFECLIDHFDAEKDVYPYPDDSFDTVLCCELIEHLASDPMFLMSEVNRVLKPDGYFVITTPNIISHRAIGAILGGHHPGFFTSYIRPTPDGEAEARHNREYSPGEIEHLLKNSGFEVVRLETGPFRDEPHPEFHWISKLIDRLQLQNYWRGDGIYAVGRKTGAIRERWPDWLYS